MAYPGKPTGHVRDWSVRPENLQGGVVLHNRDLDKYIATNRSFLNSPARDHIDVLPGLVVTQIVPFLKTRDSPSEGPKEVTTAMLRRSKYKNGLPLHLIPTVILSFHFSFNTSAENSLTTTQRPLTFKHRVDSRLSFVLPGQDHHKNARQSARET